MTVTPVTRIEVDPTGAAPGRDHRWQLVIAGGLLTTLATLAGVAALAHRGTNVMGWYGNWVIPIGALLVGACAAAGYGATAWFLGLKITRRPLFAIIALLVASYLVAQYEEYAQQHLQIGFFKWFDLMSRSFSFKEHDGSPGSPLGAAGYFFRALELAGFTAGGVLYPLALHKKAYCEACRTYHRTRAVAWLRGNAQTATPVLDRIFTAAADGDRSAFDQVIAAEGPLADKRKVNRAAERIGVFIASCPRCANGTLIATRFAGRGSGIRRTVVGTTPLDGKRIRALLG